MIKIVKKIFNNEKGFTLIELLAVIMILGIIGGIAVVAISGQGEKARFTSNDTNILNIQNSAERYDLERGLRFDATNSDYTVITETHPLIVEGYLTEVVSNPWADTNETQANFKYILTRDARGVMYVYLAEVTGGVVQKIVKINGVKEAEAVNVSTLTDLSFVNNTTALTGTTTRLFR